MHCEPKLLFPWPVKLLPLFQMPQGKKKETKLKPQTNNPPQSTAFDKLLAMSTLGALPDTLRLDCTTVSKKHLYYMDICSKTFCPPTLNSSNIYHRPVLYRAYHTRAIPLRGQCRSSWGRGSRIHENCHSNTRKHGCPLSLCRAWWLKRNAATQSPKCG